MALKIFITGSKGFIGSHLTKYLINLGYDVFEYLGDITSPITYYGEKPNVVIHLAAIVSTPWVAEADWYAYDVNVKGTYNVAKFAKEQGADFIYVSSTSIYKPTSQPITEESEVRPTTLYNFTKWLGELVTQHIFKDDALIIRPSHIYGPGRDHDSNIMKVMRAAVYHYPAVLLANPEAYKAYLYIDDLVEAFALAISKNLKGIYNISSEERVRLRDIIDLVLRTLEKHGLRPVSVIYRPETDYMGTHVVLSQKFRKATGWVPKVSLEEGVEKCAVWISKMGAALSSLEEE